jgi:hypothetical protein
VNVRMKALAGMFVVAGFLGACGGSDGDESSSAPNSTNQTTTTAEQSQMITAAELKSCLVHADPTARPALEPGAPFVEGLGLGERRLLSAWGDEQEKADVNFFIFDDEHRARRAEPKVRPKVKRLADEAQKGLKPSEIANDPLHGFETAVRKNVLVVSIYQPQTPDQGAIITDLSRLAPVNQTLG